MFIMVMRPPTNPDDDEDDAAAAPNGAGGCGCGCCCGTNIIPVGRFGAIVMAPLASLYPALGYMGVVVLGIALAGLVG